MCLYRIIYEHYFKYFSKVMNLTEYELMNQTYFECYESDVNKWINQRCCVVSMNESEYIIKFQYCWPTYVYSKLHNYLWVAKKRFIFDLQCKPTCFVNFYRFNAVLNLCLNLLQHFQQRGLSERSLTKSLKLFFLMPIFLFLS